MNTAINTQQLKDLGAIWEQASDNPLILKKGGLVGFCLDEKGHFFPGSWDEFALRESFRFCQENGIPLADELEATLFNSDPKQGGKDILAYEGPVLDWLIYSRVYEGGEIDESAESRRLECLEEQDYTMWVSPHKKTYGDWLNSAVRSGAKMIFIAGSYECATVGTEEFLGADSPYGLLKPISIQLRNCSIALRSDKPVLGVLIRKDYAAALGIRCMTDKEKEKIYRDELDRRVLENFKKEMREREKQVKTPQYWAERNKEIDEEKRRWRNEEAAETQTITPNPPACA